MEAQDKKRIEGIRRASREIVHSFGLLNEAHSPVGLSHQQCHVLLEIESEGMGSVGQLSQSLNLDKSSVSRAIAVLDKKGLVKTKVDPIDKRQKHLYLSQKGFSQLEKMHTFANNRVHQAIQNLSTAQQKRIFEGMALYAEALKKQRKQEGLHLRPIRKEDNDVMRAIILAGMKEFGAVGEGFASGDAELNQLHSTYTKARSAYFVIEQEGQVVGGAGLGPLRGGPKSICEFRKMFLLRGWRSKGAGKTLLNRCLSEAKKMGYKKCYLETLSKMAIARSLYEKLGFKLLKKPMGNTGHHSADCWYLRGL